MDAAQCKARHGLQTIPCRHARLGWRPDYPLL